MMTTASATRVRMLLIGMAAWAVAGGAVQATRGDEKPRVKPAGLRIVAEPYGGEDNMRAFNFFPGTALVLLVEHPGGGLVGVDDDASSLDSLTDDKDNNLLVQRQFVTNGFAGFPSISGDNKAALIEIHAGGLPAEGTRAIRAKGTLVIQHATQLETAAQKDIEVKPGTSVKLGPFTFELTKTGKPEWGDKPLQITLKTQGPTGAIKAIRFRNADGESIAASNAGRMEMTVMGTTTTEMDYQLAEKVDAISIELEYWQDMQTIEVPFDLTVSIGL